MATCEIITKTTPLTIGTIGLGYTFEFTSTVGVRRMKVEKGGLSASVVIYPFHHPDFGIVTIVTMAQNNSFVCKVQTPSGVCVTHPESHEYILTVNENEATAILGLYAAPQSYIKGIQNAIVSKMVE